MGNDSLNKGAQADAKKENNGSGASRFKGVKTRRRVGRQAIWGTFGGVFISAAFSIHTWPSIAFALAGIICGSVVLNIELKNRSFAHPIPRNWGFGLAVCAFAVWLVVFIAQQDKAQEHPRFRFFVSTGKGAAKWLALTNDFLFPTKVNELFLPIGALVVPVEKNQELRNLRFFVRNDSAATAESACAWIRFSKDFAADIDPKWTVAYDFGPSNNLPVMHWPARNGTNEMEMDGFVFFLPNMLPGNGQELPKIIFESGPLPTASLFSLVVRAKDSPSQMVCFRLCFWENKETGGRKLSGPVIAKLVSNSPSGPSLVFPD